jgi:sec-independent protein translocase protein TatC
MSTQEMSFWDHLEELRWMLLRIIIALFVFAIGAFIIMPWLFDTIIMAPAKPDFVLYSSLCSLSHKFSFLPDFCEGDFTVDMVNLELTAPFFRHLSTSGWVALVLICPYILFEIWRFISPALYEHEKKNIRWVFLLGSIMFFIGCVFSYFFIFPITFRFLYTYNLSPVIHNQVSLDSYLDNFVTLILIMGLVFEMPLISWLLSQIGILKRSFFKKYRRHAIVILLVIAAVITPTGDPFTLSMVFVPLYALYEISIFFVKEDPKEEDEDEVSLEKI